MSIPYPIQRSKRKTVQIRIDAQGAVSIRAPYRISAAEIERIVGEKQDWINAQVAAQKARDARREHPSDEQIAAWKQAARTELPALTAAWARRMGVLCTGVKITSAARRWGSCSSRDSICYSYRIMRLPPALREYIVVHELAHIRQKNHSPAFYTEVARFLPDYKQRIAALRAFERQHPMD